MEKIVINSHFSAWFFTKPLPLCRGFPDPKLRYFPFETGQVYLMPSQPNPKTAEALLFPPPKIPTRTSYIYTNLYHTYTISTACMACHLTGSQISLQADWLWLCSLQASVHIYIIDTTETLHGCMRVYIINFHINL